MSSESKPPEHIRERLFKPIPESILIPFCVLVGIELIFIGGTYGLWGGPEAVGWRVSYIENFGFSDPLFERMLTFGMESWDKVVRCLSYVLFSSSTTEAIFGCLMFLAVGKYAADRMTPFTLFTMIFATTLASSIGFSLLVDTEQMLTGPLALTFGLIAFYGLREAVVAKMSGKSWLVGFSLPIFILSIDMVASWLTSQPPFWVARLSAFAMGLLLSFFVSGKGTLSFATAQWYLGRK